MMQLRLDQVTKSFDGHRAIDGVQLAIENVRALVLIGPSGSGKSTLLRILAGLEFPDSGAVEINGEPMHFAEPELLRHRRVLRAITATSDVAAWLVEDRFWGEASGAALAKSAVHVVQ